MAEWFRHRRWLRIASWIGGGALVLSLIAWILAESWLIPRAVDEMTDIIHQEAEKEVAFEVGEPIGLASTTATLSPTTSDAGDSAEASDLLQEASAQLAHSVRDQVAERVIQKFAHQMGVAVQQELVDLMRHRLEKVVKEDLARIIQEELKERGITAF